MGRIYNVVLDSNFNYSTGSSLADYSYYINWDNIMPQGSYKMTFSFQSVASTQFDTDPAIGLALPLGGNDYFSSKNLTSSGSTQFVGNLKYLQFGTNYYLYGDQNSNPPIYLQQRPNQTNFTVTICNGIDTTVLCSTPESYILIMSFEALDQSILKTI